VSASNLHLAWARLFLRAAASSGVTDVVLSPGSRSTPLAIAALESASLRTEVIVDERSAAFYALGQARVTGRPSLLVCTSGTAGAHYFPAIIEASQSFLPMIAVTADRPWELQDAAAPQTIDQLKLFGSHVRHFAELGLPDPSPSALRAVPRIAARAVSLAMGPLPGPVHLNASFRKPLEPVNVEGPEAWEPLWSALMERGAPRVCPGISVADERTVADLCERIARAERGLIVCGPAPLSAAAGRDALLDLARKTGFPLLAEGTSQLRFGGDHRGVVAVSSFDAVLRAPAFRARHAPDLLVEIGAPATSAGYAELLAQHAGCARVVIAPHGWNDPAGDASTLIFADPAELCRRLAAQLPARAARSPWSESFARADALACELAARSTDGEPLSGARIVSEVVSAAPEGSILVIGNSTPVRDLDAFCPASGRALQVIHQRGASGIDGLVSGAAGARSVTTEPVTLLLGDLSLLHDLGGLAVLRRAQGPLVVVVVQNGGGKIFEQLPIAKSVDAALLARGFTTPEDVSFAQAAAAFGLPYLRAESAGDLARALQAGWSARGATLIEAVVPPGEGARRMAKLWADVRAGLAAVDNQGESR
jgi:2-succinyl-5-enolpyruvyl-6-hydroxy-3-cyclohexene-1-carboxylate synthase